jgi:DNA-binding GntR family transcriptional regulator
VTLMRNRGAMVSRPSVREAREVFAARRLIETSIVETVIKSATRKEIKRLQEHVASELLERCERAAIKLMVQHLDHVFADLMLEERNGSGIDLKTVFGARQ